MRKLSIYDRPMCCSTGVCGPEVDPILPTFAADLEWLKSQGYEVERYNLAQQPLAFIENKVIHEILSTEGTDPLPVVLIDQQILSKKLYPSREQLLSWLKEAPKMRGLVVTDTSEDCCESGKCC